MPPQQGWPQQQQQPPHQGWQQPGWGPPQPPGKSKAPLVIGILAGVVVLAVAITGVVLHLNVNKDGGSSKRADKLPSLCGNVSEAALAKARTTNPNGLGSHETKVSNGTRTICSWNQTKGVDGKGHRSTDVYVSSDDMKTDFDRLVAQHMDTRGVPQQKPLEGLGDQATAVLVEGDSAYTDIWIVVRKGDTVIEVDYSGWDAGLFTNAKPDVAEFEAAAKGIAEEVVTKI